MLAQWPHTKLIYTTMPTLSFIYIEFIIMDEKSYTYTSNNILLNNINVTIRQKSSDNQIIKSKMNNEWLINQMYEMQVDHKTYKIPEQIGRLKIKKLGWSDFKGRAPQNTWLMAHIWWAIEYQFINQKDIKQPYVKATVCVLEKSWVGSQDLKLLEHEYGHYLLGCLCALSFEQKVNYELQKPDYANFGDWCKKQLQLTIKQYCLKQKKYYQETYHYLNRNQQCQWQLSIKEEFQYFYQYFKDKKLVPQSTKQQKHQFKLKETDSDSTNSKKRPVTVKKNIEKPSTGSRRSSIIKQINLYRQIQSNSMHFPKLPPHKFTFNNK